MTMQQTGTTAIISALERLLSSVRDNHPDIPYLLVSVSPATSGRSYALARFDRGAWRDQPTLWPELTVSWDVLSMGPEMTLREILKELTHCLAEVRGIRDTSKEGVYHNKHYVSLGTELGLYWPSGVTFDPNTGYEDMKLHPDTVTKYAPELSQLRDLTLSLNVAVRPKPGPSGRNNVKLTCLCGRIIRASKMVADGPAIVCSGCGGFFSE